VQIPGGPAAVREDEILRMPLSRMGWEGEESRVIPEPEDDFMQIPLNASDENAIW
jgi:hypothetical protein